MIDGGYGSGGPGVTYIYMHAAIQLHTKLVTYKSHTVVYTSGFMTHEWDEHHRRH
jgi:hypothetical protein